jgi:indolepyruvate ferredoxin oxidoreductase alpha subunit
MERSFKKEVDLLRLAQGQVFHCEGILAVTKALLQSGVSYISGYQGAPVSHLIDVLADASEILDELGITFESSGSEAGAAAMLGASINTPLRGAATWKSVVGTNVASDALSNLSSAGVKGGVVVILGEDYGGRSFGSILACELNLSCQSSGAIERRSPVRHAPRRGAQALRRRVSNRSCRRVAR